MIELNLRRRQPPAQAPPPRYFGGAGTAAAIASVDSAEQRKQYQWALSRATGPGSLAPLGRNASGQPIRKKRKKTRSKQKNRRKDTRTPEQRSAAQAQAQQAQAAAAAAAAAAEPESLDELVLQLHLDNPRLGAKRLTALVRESRPELARGAKEVRQALARVQQAKRRRSPSLEPDEPEPDASDDGDAWWQQGPFARGGADYCDVRLPPPAQHPTCCICGLAGHSREECAEPVPQMPGPDVDYRKVSGRERRGKSSGSGGAKRKKHGSKDPRNGAVQTFSKRQKFAAESSSAHVRRQKSGKVREAGKRPKGGWAPNPKGGGGGGPKGKPRRPVKQTRRERRAEKRGVARYKRP